VTYPGAYFDELGDYAWSSARTVVPLVLEHVPADSVVDVGCATGVWLAVFREHGVTRVLGLDGDYVERSGLHIPTECFRPVDLSRPFTCDGRFDLAVSLEVAEHLPKASAAGFVASLCQLAPIVLFSAAVPGQRGRHHVNEQWPEYWRQLFAEHGFRMFDPLRPLVWHNDEVAYYYRQNMFLFVSEAALVAYPQLARLPEVKDASALLLVAPHMVLDHLGVIGVLKRLPGLAVAGVKRRLERLRS